MNSRSGRSAPSADHASMANAAIGASEMAGPPPRPPADRTSPLDAAALEQTMRKLVVRELAGFMGHEVNQPLGAIAAHAAAGERWLQKGNYNEVAAALRDIAADV